MKTSATPLERGLLLALASAFLLACFGPAVAQHPHYHAFADQRSWFGLPCAMDLLSNLPFAIGGLWGLWMLQHLPIDPTPNAQRPLATLFFAGLVLTALCSSIYHWQPDNAGLLLDRLGMVVAFAGLLGLAAADRVSPRAGGLTAGAVLLLGPLCVAVWATSGNLLPWVVLQGGGMLLILLLAACKPVSGAWGLPLGAVMGLYALAKLLELGDHAVFAWTQGLVSGHSLKHAVAALVAWPVIAVMHNAAQGKPRHAQPMSLGHDGV
ncbi:MAG: hypothetical protein V4713_16020 [Pseudomonadota bacterium]